MISQQPATNQVKNTPIMQNVKAKPQLYADEDDTPVEENKSKVHMANTGYDGFGVPAGGKNYYQQQQQQMSSSHYVQKASPGIVPTQQQVYLQQQNKSVINPSQQQQRQPPPDI